jgi:DOR family
MFNSLFNSLFGKSQDNTNLNSSDDNNSSQETDQTYVVKEINSNVTAIFLEEDNDWLFVEKTDEKDSTRSEKSSKNLQLVPFQSILSHLGSISENDENSFLSANLPSLYPNSMDDSWFLTPPECFSSISSIQLESSPLENLLIEHPSMSVYYNFRRGYNNNAIGDRDNVIDDLVVLELSQNDMEEEQTGKVEKLPAYLLLAFH